MPISLGARAGGHVQVLDGVASDGGKRGYTNRCHFLLAHAGGHAQVLDGVEQEFTYCIAHVLECLCLRPHPRNALNSRMFSNLRLGSM